MARNPRVPHRSTRGNIPRPTSGPKRKPDYASFFGYTHSLPTGAYSRSSSGLK